MIFGKLSESGTTISPKCAGLVHLPTNVTPGALCAVVLFVKMLRFQHKLLLLFIIIIIIIIIVIIIIIIINNNNIIISFMQGIYTYIPETNHVPREYSVSAILSLLFMVSISLVPALAQILIFLNLLSFLFNHISVSVSRDCNIY